MTSGLARTRFQASPVPPARKGVLNLPEVLRSEGAFDIHGSFVLPSTNQIVAAHVAHVVSTHQAQPRWRRRGYTTSTWGCWGTSTRARRA